jgi:alpha-D-ribose 1-methylphosphonate 5-triphosphate diphosphatase PhnM
MWLSVDLPDAAGAKLNDEFVKVFDADQTRVILEAVAAGIIPKEMAYDALKSTLPVRDDLDWQEARAMMEDDSRMAGAGQPASAASIAAGLLGPTPGTGSTTT